MAKKKVSKAKPKKAKPKIVKGPNSYIADDPINYPQNAKDSKNIIEKNGDVFQRPDPVVPIEDAVAKDAPVYENLPKEDK